MLSPAIGMEQKANQRKDHKHHARTVNGKSDRCEEGIEGDI